MDEGEKAAVEKPYRRVKYRQPPDSFEDVFGANSEQFTPAERRKMEKERRAKGE